jgi:hypothetical protein
MTQAERSNLEQLLFLQVNHNKKIREVVTLAREKYKAVLEVMDVHEARFGIRYCDAILNSNDVVPHYLQLARQLKEPTTTYYDYRKQVLRTIKELLKAQSTTDI